MGNPLLLFWHFIFEPLDGDAEPSARSADRVGGPSGQLAQGGGPGVVPAAATSDARFLVLRRMRVPLLVLVLVFSISVLGLTLIPGQQPDGGTAPMTFFEALYFMTYTAATIGYGEIPYELTTPQRMWVTFAIYLAVIGWAYAIGSLLAMLQDKGFRREIGARRFARQVRHMSEPFWILAGYGEAGARVTAELDRRGHRLVVLDRAQERVDALDLAALRAEYQKQKQAGVQDKLARFDRPGAVARQQKALAGTDADASQACGTPVKTAVNWEGLSDDQLQRLSISGFCGTVADAMRSLCGSDAAFKPHAAKHAQIECRFGDRLNLRGEGGKLLFTTEEKAPNQGDFALQYLRNQ